MFRGRQNGPKKGEECQPTICLLLGRAYLLDAKSSFGSLLILNDCVAVTFNGESLSTAVRLHVYLVFVKSIEQELKIQ